MFQSYELIDHFPTISDIGIRIIDSDFTEVIVASTSPSGLNIVTPAILLYESKGLNVGANIAKLFLYVCDRFKIEPKTYFERMSFINADFRRYKSDIEKYLTLV